MVLVFAASEQGVTMKEPCVFSCVLCGNDSTISGKITIDWNLRIKGDDGFVAAWFEGDEVLDLLEMFAADPASEGCKKADLSLDTGNATVTAPVRIERIGGSSAQLWFLHPEAIERLRPHE